MTFTHLAVAYILNQAIGRCPPSPAWQRLKGRIIRFSDVSLSFGEHGIRIIPSHRVLHDHLFIEIDFLCLPFLKNLKPVMRGDTLLLVDLHYAFSHVYQHQPRLIHHMHTWTKEITQHLLRQYTHLMQRAWHASPSLLLHQNLQERALALESTIHENAHMMTERRTENE